jgi:ATP-dependent DNA ligase
LVLRRKQRLTQRDEGNSNLKWREDSEGRRWRQARRRSLSEQVWPVSAQPGAGPPIASCLANVVGYYRGDDLIYVARARNGLVPASRRGVFEKLKPLVTPECSFVNLPETRKARRGKALSSEKMKKCVWVRPEVVAQIEFLEWIDADHLRHSKFAGLRDDKDPRNVRKKQS